jgi:hypothetical protein
VLDALANAPIEEIRSWIASEVPVPGPVSNS